MKSKIKYFIITFIIIFVIIIFNICIFKNFIAMMFIKQILNHKLGTELSLGKVEISLGSTTELSATNIFFFNENDSKTLKIKNIRFGVNLFTLLNNKIQVTQLIVDNPEIYVENKTKEGLSTVFTKINKSDSTQGFVKKLRYNIESFKILSAKILVHNEFNKLKTIYKNINIESKNLNNYSDTILIIFNAFNDSKGYCRLEVEKNTKDNIFNAALEFRDFNIGDYDLNYFLEKMHISKLSGSISGNINAYYKASSSVISANGHISLNQLEIIDSEHLRRILQCNTFEIELEKYLISIGNEIIIRKIIISDLKLDLRHYKENKNNYSKLLTSLFPKEEKKKSSSVLIKKAEAEKIALVIHNNTDSNTVLYSLPIIDITASNLNSNTKDKKIIRQDICIKNHYKNTGFLLNVNFTKNSKSKKSTAEFIIKNLGLPELSSALLQYTGISILNGDADMIITYEKFKDIVSLNTEIKVKKLVIKEDFSEKNNQSYSINHAISTLLDKDGNLELNVPVTGNLKDPEFNFKEEIKSSFANSIIGAAAAGALFNRNSDQNKFPQNISPKLYFSLNDWSLNDDQKKYILKCYKNSNIRLIEKFKMILVPNDKQAEYDDLYIKLCKNIYKLKNNIDQKVIIEDSNEKFIEFLKVNNAYQNMSLENYCLKIVSTKAVEKEYDYIKNKKITNLMQFLQKEGIEKKIYNILYQIAIKITKISNQNQLNF